MKQHSGVKIREAQELDAPALAALYRSFVDSPHVNVCGERVKAIASDPNNFLFVCEVGDVVCGTAFLTLCLDAMFGKQPYGVIENVVIEEAWREKGVGSLLFAHLEELCRARDCSKIMLLSSASREGAHRFFERHGYSSENKRGFVKYRSQFR